MASHVVKNLATSSKSIIYVTEDATPEEIQKKVNISLSLGIPRENIIIKVESPRRSTKRSKPEPSSSISSISDEELRIKVARLGAKEQRIRQMQEAISYQAAREIQEFHENKLEVFQELVRRMEKRD